MLAADHLHALILGIDWTDPAYLLDRFGAAFLWISLVMVFVECGLLFPFLPGDTLLLSLGIFIATPSHGIDNFPGPRLLELAITLVLLTVAAVLGNVVGYEIGRAVGPPLYRRDGRILKKKYFDNTQAFFDKHGNKALVIGRFVPFVRTYITVVAGVTRMERRRFLVWSFVGARPVGVQHHPARLQPGPPGALAARQHRLRDPRHPAAVGGAGRHRVRPSPPPSRRPDPPAKPGEPAGHRGPEPSQPTS